MTFSWRTFALLNQFECPLETPTFWNKLHIWFVFQSKGFFSWRSTCLTNLSQARVCVWWACHVQTHCLYVYVCRRHWFLRCSCPFAPHNIAAGATPALVACGMSHPTRAAGTNKNHGISRQDEFLEPGSPCWVPSSNTILAEVSGSLSQHII